MKKILIVDDDKNIVRALMVRLKAEGFEIKFAYDAMMGVVAARKEEPDLLILDISMPAGGGFSVAERVQSLSQTAGVPMIFLTASRKPGVREQARELGAFAFFEKPYNLPDLLECVHSALGTTPTKPDPAPAG